MPRFIKVRLIFNLIIIIGLFTACNNDDRQKQTSKMPPMETTGAIEIINDDFSQHSNQWKYYEGAWLFANGVLKQTSTENSFPVILYENKALMNVDIQVQFKALSGDTDASGGIIFRAIDEDNYYIVRANALEDNFRLYTFSDGLRHQLASATVIPPTLGEFHSMRVIAKGDHIQAYLDNKLALDYHDNTFKEGYTGLWTKADSVTLFDNFKVSEY